MKVNHLILLIFLFIPQLSLSQEYEVLDSKKVKKIDGSKVKKGQPLSTLDSISIGEKGYLTLDVESAMHLKLAPGKYDVGREAKRLNEWYDTHLELTKKLKRDGLISCKFRYKTLAVPGSNRHYEVDRIELYEKGLVKINSDTASMTVKWVNPDHKYSGTYRLVIRDFYNQGFIDIIETDENMITFYPGKYGHRHMYYNIIANDCRASLRYKIQVNSTSSSPFSQTNFLSSDN
ncbi:hypothetical protein [Ekhidna sp.]